MKPSKEKLKKYLKEAFVFIIVLFVASNGVSLYRSSQLHLDDDICADGVDVVHFWATWCPVCKTEAFNIDFLTRSYNVRTIAVKSGEDEEIKDYLRRNDLHFRFVNDVHGDIASKYAITVFPTTVICHQKKVKFAEVGYTSTAGLLVRLWLSRF